ncbi:hypothetical protein AMAG_08312 [Allomyces macrogynus ATCC 38327]|uniref:Uncharacterized protein n=1 Tax=Allomyces macrogynus (strain ATCC 38327) TaxID=578462 RepID=A0A0L0SL41_ALLM3|nr:hypothetical protein AMAG_08312 [Allomyces macrogynus ATCC 38327]|eukprot:KNE63153.1 hypothetical protein AMAG_08312 [Allomyces macrogynus ATCC 38327]
MDQESKQLAAMSLGELSDDIPAPNAPTSHAPANDLHHAEDACASQEGPADEALADNVPASDAEAIFPATNVSTGPESADPAAIAAPASRVTSATKGDDDTAPASIPLPPSAAPGTAPDTTLSVPLDVRADTAAIAAVIASWHLDKAWAHSTVSATAAAVPPALVADLPAHYVTTFSKPAPDQPIPAATCRAYWRKAGSGAAGMPERWHFRIEHHHLVLQYDIALPVGSRSPTASTPQLVGAKADVQRLLEFILDRKGACNQWWDGLQHQQKRTEDGRGLAA